MIGFPHTVTRLRAAKRTDGLGLPVEQRDWVHATEASIAGVSVQPASSSESRANGATAVTSTWRLISQPGGDIDLVAGDRVVHGDLTLDVVGEPERWPSLSGGVHHVEAVLQLAPATQAPAGGAEAGLGRALAGKTVSRGWTP